MNKTVKNIILVFTLVCLIVLVVFVIELFVQNRGTEDSGGAAAAPASGAPASTGGSNARPPASPAGNGPSSGESSSGQPEAPAKPAGKRYELPYSAYKTLFIYVDEELFKHIEMDSGDMFVYIGEDPEEGAGEDSGEGKASLEICPVPIPDGAEACAETFLDGYLEGNESFVSGTSQIKQSALSGIFVSGVKDGETFEAWIHDTADGSGGKGIAFVLRYSDNEQKSALYAILDTLELFSVEPLTQ